MNFEPGDKVTTRLGEGVVIAVNYLGHWAEVLIGSDPHRFKFSEIRPVLI